MAGKTKEMSQIKQLLLLKKESVSNRKTADIVGINRETANNYMKKALADELGIDGLLKLDDPVLEHRLNGGSPAYTDKRFEVFKEMLPYLWVAKAPLRYRRRKLCSDSAQPLGGFCHNWLVAFSKGSGLRECN